jgi:exonuclease III
MNSMIRIATQNLNWGGEAAAPGADGQPRLSRLVSTLESLDADVLVLTEFKTGVLGDEVETLLADAGYPHFLHHPQEPYRLGSAMASRMPLTPTPFPVPPPFDPWRAVGATVGGIAIFGVYFPLREPKRTYWNWLLENARVLRDCPVLLAGDFNTGKAFVDEVGDTFDCQGEFIALESLGYDATWLNGNGDNRDYTWYSTAGNGFRLDYLWASPTLGARLSRAWLDHRTRTERASDHSAVIADFVIPSAPSSAELDPEAFVQPRATD